MNNGSNNSSDMTLDPSSDGVGFCVDFSALPANLTAVMRTGDTAVQDTRDRLL